MSALVYIDVIGGAAGDMLLAALIDAGASLERVREGVDSVLPSRFDIQPEEVRRGGLRGLHLAIRRRGGNSDELRPRAFVELVDVLNRAPLPKQIGDTARSILERLGQAEARVHGIGLEELQLHELGDDDTLLDVVGVAVALADLEADRVLVSPIPLGSGRMRAESGRHAHGHVPLPATVTLELLRGFAVRGEGADETVTPTAAAVFAALGEPSEGVPFMTLAAVGYGAGTDDPPDRANVVRVLVGSSAKSTAADEGPARRSLVLLEANLDDLSPELVADAAQALLAAGALDVWTAPIQMKKGRPGVVLSALCDPQVRPRLSEVFFEATSTFGVRAIPVQRAELERRTIALSLPDGTVRVKLGLLRGRVVSAAPEHDDVAALAARTGRSVRDVYEEAAAAARSLRLETADE